MPISPSESASSTRSPASRADAHASGVVLDRLVVLAQHRVDQTQCVQLAALVAVEAALAQQRERSCERGDRCAWIVEGNMGVADAVRGDRLERD